MESWGTSILESLCKEMNEQWFFMVFHVQRFGFGIEKWIMVCDEIILIFEHLVLSF